MPIISAKIREATSTNVELLCNSLNFGQETFVLISSTESLINAVNFSIIIFAMRNARVERLELPANGFGDRYSTIELHPYLLS